MISFYKLKYGFLDAPAKPEKAFKTQLKIAIAEKRNLICRKDPGIKPFLKCPVTIDLIQGNDIVAGANQLVSHSSCRG